MRLVYDGFIYRVQQAGGINRYFAEIISRLPENYEPIILGAESLGCNAPRHRNLRIVRPSALRPRRFSEIPKRLWWQMKYLKSADVFHPTYYQLSSGLSFANCRGPLVITIYDLINVIYPGLAEAGDYKAKCQSEAVRRADKIICISHSTKNDLLKHFPQVAEKVEVIHLACSYGERFQTKPQIDRNVCPTFLFVGARAGYKNFLFLLRAFSKAAQTCPQIQLHVAGAPLEPEERWQIHFLKLSSKVSVTEYPSEEKLQALYAESIALLYPSRHEGFGIPPLEAMASRIVPITANTSSLPEVMGRAGLMIDPDKEEDWANAIVALTGGGAFYDDLVARGDDQVRRFSWESTAEGHLEVYRNLT